MSSSPDAAVRAAAGQPGGRPQRARALLGNREIAYLDVGGRLPLVLLHAFPLDHAMWRRQVHAFVPDRRIVAPDLSGFGRSGTPGAPSVAAHADDVAALLDALRIEAVAAMGLSMGGYVALELWRRHRSRVAALVLADTRAGADSPADRERRAQAAARVRELGVSAWRHEVLPGLIGDRPRTAIAAEVAAIVDRQPADGIIAALHAMAGRQDFGSELASIAVPTLVVVGSDDVVSPLAEARRMSDAIAGSQLAVIPGATHLSNMDEPGAFNAAVRAFLESVDTGRSGA